MAAPIPKVAIPEVHRHPTRPVDVYHPSPMSRISTLRRRQLLYRNSRFLSTVRTTTYTQDINSRRRLMPRKASRCTASASNMEDRRWFWAFHDCYSNLGVSIIRMMDATSILFPKEKKERKKRKKKGEKESERVFSNPPSVSIRCTIRRDPPAIKPIPSASVDSCGGRLPVPKDHLRQHRLRSMFFLVLT